MLGRVVRPLFGQRGILRVWKSNWADSPAAKQRKQAAVASALTGEQWAWTPPRKKSDNKGKDGDTDVLPVRRGELLSLDEVEVALKKSGAEDVVRLPLDPPLDTVTHFVVASGTSRLHLRRMGDSLVRALKKRRLKQAPGMRGFEGNANDDWILVDCYDTVIHLLMPSTRQALALEEHWAPGAQRPFLVDAKKEEVLDKRLDRLCDEFEIPEEYYRYWDEDQTALGDSALGSGAGTSRHISNVPSPLDLDTDYGQKRGNRNEIAARRRRAKANAEIRKSRTRDKEEDDP
mgnify:CR=1 FL=1